MNDEAPSQTSNWFELAGLVMKRYDLKTETELAAMLGIKQTQLSNWKAGRNDISPIVKLVILDKLGFAFARDALAAVLPERLSSVMIQADRHNTKQRIRRKLSELSLSLPDEKPHPIQKPSATEKPSKVHRAEKKRSSTDTA